MVTTINLDETHGAVFIIMNGYEYYFDQSTNESIFHRWRVDDDPNSDIPCEIPVAWHNYEEHDNMIKQEFQRLKTIRN